MKGVYDIKVKLQKKEDVISMKWPDNNLKFCGRLIPTRKCDKDSRDPMEGTMISKKFCFSRLDTCEEG